MIVPIPSTTRFVLVHHNTRRERHYFVALGDPWPGRPERRMIAKTTKDKADARVFDTVPEAMEMLITAGDPPNWQTETL